MKKLSEIKSGTALEVAKNAAIVAFIAIVPGTLTCYAGYLLVKKLIEKVKSDKDRKSKTDNV